MGILSVRRERRRVVGCRENSPGSNVPFVTVRALTCVALEGIGPDHPEAAATRHCAGGDKGGEERNKSKDMCTHDGSVVLDGNGVYIYKKIKGVTIVKVEK